MGSSDNLSSRVGRRNFLRVAGATGVAGLTGLAGCGGTGGGTGSETTTTGGTTSSGDTEGELVIYSPVPQNLVSWFEDQTDISVDVVTGVGPKITARFFQEQSSGQYNADLLYGPTSTFLPSPDTTTKFTQPITEFDIDRKSVMPDDLYQKWSKKMPGDIFDRLMPYHTLTNRVFAASSKLDSPPTSYADLKDESYDGNIVAQPFFMDTNAAVLKRTLGSEDAAKSYLQTLKSQNLLLQVKEIQPILENRVQVCFLALDTGGMVTRMSQGAPITASVPEEGVPQTSPAWVVAKNAPHPKAAQKFLEMQFSEEAQQYIQGVKGGRDPIRPDYEHGNPTLKKVLDGADQFPMMLTTDEINAAADLATEVWPDISV
ncbi:MAG: ABC transporter substrate-binding protein [Salinigranum sp.]